MKKHRAQHYMIVALVPLSVGLFLYFVVPIVLANKYTTGQLVANVVNSEPTLEAPVPAPIVVTHLETPEVVKAVYMSSWAAGSPAFRTKVIALIDEKEINAVVIDVKDSTGRISFAVHDPKLVAIGSVENRIKDIDALVALLHQKNIYIIGRVAVFQDQFFPKLHPELSVKKKSSPETLWADYKGMHWLDAGTEVTWDYVSEIGEEAYSRGFDEINFDYIRFPADGNLKDAYYPISHDKKRSDVVGSFYSYLDTRFHPEHIPISGDIFGMTTTNTDDLGIGQLLENALLHFDYVAPMVYPSHYYKGFLGFKDVNAHPYDIVKYSMDHALTRLTALKNDPTTPEEIRARISPGQLRPWLQDFKYPVTYTAEMVRAQIKATNDAGVSSWMLWDPTNKYTPSALLSQ